MSVFWPLIVPPPVRCTAFAFSRALAASAATCGPVLALSPLPSEPPQAVSRTAARPIAARWRVRMRPPGSLDIGTPRYRDPQGSELLPLRGPVDRAVGAGQPFATATPAAGDDLGGDGDRRLLRRAGAQVQPDG